MRAVAEECFALVREYKGAHSGEHGDGIARSEFKTAMFGARIARAFETVKDAFDPDGIAQSRTGSCARRGWMIGRCFATGRTMPRSAGSSQAGLVGASRPARRHAGRGGDVQQQRHLPKFRCRCDVPELSCHAR